MGRSRNYFCSRRGKKKLKTQKEDSASPTKEARCLDGSQSGMGCRTPRHCRGGLCAFLPKVLECGSIVRLLTSAATSCWSFVNSLPTPARVRGESDGNSRSRCRRDEE